MTTFSSDVCRRLFLNFPSSFASNSPPLRSEPKFYWGAYSPNPLGRDAPNSAFCPRKPLFFRTNVVVFAFCPRKVPFFRTKVIVFCPPKVFFKTAFGRSYLNLQPSGFEQFLAPPERTEVSLGSVLPKPLESLCSERSRFGSEIYISNLLVMNSRQFYSTTRILAYLSRRIFSPASSKRILAFKSALPPEISLTTP